MMKKFISFLFIPLLALALCVSSVGCDDEPSIDTDAVKITINGTDVAYEYRDSDREAFFYDFTTTPTDFRFVSPYEIHFLLIDLGENPVKSVEVDSAYLVESDSAFIANSETFATRDGHTTLRYVFQMPTTDLVRFHFTVAWSDEPVRVTQYGFSIRCAEEA